MRPLAEVSHTTADSWRVRVPALNEAVQLLKCLTQTVALWNVLTIAKIAHQTKLLVVVKPPRQMRLLDSQCTSCEAYKCSWMCLVPARPCTKREFTTFFFLPTEWNHDQGDDETLAVCTLLVVNHQQIVPHPRVTPSTFRPYRNLFLKFVPSIECGSYHRLLSGIKVPLQLKLP